MKQVIFKTSDDIDKGYSLFLHGGTILYTGEKGKYMVGEESKHSRKQM